MFAQLLRGVQLRRISFLTEPEWQDKPWSVNKRDQHDDLVDILLEIPRIYVDLDAVQHEESPSKVLRGAVLAVRACWRLDAKLQTWFKGFEASVDGPLFWPELSTPSAQADSEKTERLSPVRYSFPGMRLGQTMVLYWTGLVTLHQQMCHLYRQLQGLAAQVNGRPSSGGDMTCTCNDDAGAVVPMAKITACVRHFELGQLPRLGQRQAWPTTAAQDICQSVDYFLQDEMRSLGSGVIVPPLLLVCWLLEREPGNFKREVTWVKCLLALVQKKGSEIASCDNEEPETTPWKIRA